MAIAIKGVVWKAKEGGRGHELREVSDAIGFDGYKFIQLGTDRKSEVLIAGRMVGVSMTAEKGWRVALGIKSVVTKDGERVGLKNPGFVYAEGEGNSVTVELRENPIELIGRKMRYPRSKAPHIEATNSFGSQERR